MKSKCKRLLSDREQELRLDNPNKFKEKGEMVVHLASRNEEGKTSIETLIYVDAVMCDICKGLITPNEFGWSNENNAEPVVENGICCEICDITIVIKQRLINGGTRVEFVDAIVDQLKDKIIVNHATLPSI
mgnify:CR=1 FL=1